MPREQTQPTNQPFPQNRHPFRLWRDDANHSHLLFTGYDGHRVDNTRIVGGDGTMTRNTGEKGGGRREKQEVNAPTVHLHIHTSEKGDLLTDTNKEKKSIIVKKKNKDQQGNIV